MISAVLCMNQVSVHWKASFNSKLLSCIVASAVTTVMVSQNVVCVTVCKKSHFIAIETTVQSY